MCTHFLLIQSLTYIVHPLQTFYPSSSFSYCSQAESKFQESFVYFDEFQWHFQAEETQAPSDTAENNKALTLNQKAHNFILTMQIQQLRS